MLLCVGLLPVLFQVGTAWFPSNAQGNLWRRSPFMLPSPTIDNNFVYPPPSNDFFNNEDLLPNENVAPLTPSAPVNSLEMSNNMFKLYFDQDSQGVHEPEDFLEYFRHDLGINLFHHHWHNANPFNGALVGNHRRGESFYYMHQQLLARYNVERICNGEAPIPSVHDIQVLEDDVSKKYELPIFNKPVDGPGCAESYGQMQNWTNAIIDSVVQGYAIAYTNQSVRIDVDLLGNMLQPSSKTPDGKRYGNIHNMGHNNIAYCHYKGNEKLNIQLLSDLGDTRTAPRCPVFYRFHTYVDDIFKLHQRSMQEYTKESLSYPGVELKSMKIVKESGPTTTLETFWRMIRMDNLYMRDKLTPEYDIPFHIDREDFKYEFTIENNSGENKFGMMRLFIAPVNDVKGNPLPLSIQRSLFIELDKFRVEFPPGESTLVREAEDSSVTVNFDKLFRSIIKGKFNGLDPEETNFCSCGWPDYFLLPSGSLKGIKFDIFAMLSEEQEESSSYDPFFLPPNPSAVKRTQCKEAYSYCGLMESRYPDMRPMGYPWDRHAPRWASTLTDFLTPNMLVQEIVIKHVNMTAPPSADVPDSPFPSPMPILQ